MSRRVHVALVLGCLVVCLLGAARVGSLLAQGPDGALDRYHSTQAPAQTRIAQTRIARG